jgi:hypothetical protein
MSGNLERRYWRVLRLLPGWHRDTGEEEMVAAFLDSWLTGDPETDEYISKTAGPPVRRQCPSPMPHSDRARSHTRDEEKMMMAYLQRTQEMPFQLPPRTSSVLASVLAAAGIMLSAASCSHIAPIGPDAPATPGPSHAVAAGPPVLIPPPHHLGSPIICKPCAASQPRQRASARPVTSRSPRRTPPERATASSARR